MTAFPSLIPSSRIFTPGVYPHTPYQAMSGIEGRVRHSNVMLTSTLRLTFISLTEANMLSILSHYNSKQGGFIAFTIPSQLLNGVSAAADYTLTGYLWRYVQPPIIDDIPCAGHSVELTLESVPPEAVVLSGLASTVLITLTPGAAAAANGIQQQVTITLSGGQAGSSGADFTITSSIAGGAATVTSQAVPLADIIYSQSSVYSANDPASVANMQDDNKNTGTGCNATTDTWISLDMGATYSIDRVIVSAPGASLPGGWGGGYIGGSGWRLQVSTNGSSWTNVAENTSFATSEQKTFNVSASCRYVRHGYFGGNFYLACGEFYPLAAGQSYP